MTFSEDESQWGPGRFWDAPQVSATVLGEIRKYPKTPAIVGTFIREVLPFSQIWYRETLISLLYSFAPDLNKDFRNAIETVAEPRGPSGNVDVIVQGACFGNDPDFEWVIQQFVSCEQRARTWLAEFQPTIEKAEEHVLDAAQADHIVEQPQEYFHNSHEGLETAVALRVLKEGASWLAFHKDRELLSCRFAEFLRKSEAEVSADVLRTILECTNYRAAGIWRAVEKHWDEGLTDVLHNTLLENIEDENLRQVVLRVAAGTSEGIDTLLTHLLPQMSPSRCLEIVHDLMQTTIEGDGEGEGGGPAGQAWITASTPADISRRAMLPDLTNRLPSNSPAGHFVWSIGSVAGGDESQRGAGVPVEIQAAVQNPFLERTDLQRCRAEIEDNIRNELQKLSQPRNLSVIFQDCISCGQLHPVSEVCRADIIVEATKN